MEQSLRNQYLETLGIVSWLPRRQLPGAQPTPDWVWEYCWPEADDSAGAVSNAKATPILNPADRALAAKQARAELSASFGRETNVKVTSTVAPSMTKPAVNSQANIVNTAAEVSAPSASAASIPQVASTAVMSVSTPSKPATIADTGIELSTASEQTPQKPFKLAYMVYQDCLVIDSLPPVSASARSPLNSGQADAHHQILLDKVLRSLGLSGGSASEYHTLPWPMFASKSLDQGAEQARLTVQHKLNKSLQKYPVNTVLLLGEAAAQMVLERDEPLEQLRGMLFSLRSRVKALASASLTEMMMLPGCKRDVWNDLQPL